MAHFRALTDIEMDELDDDDLVAYLVATREADHLVEATLAMRMLVYRYEDDIFGKVASKVPDHEIDGIVNKVFVAVLDKVFDGESEPWRGGTVASFKAWIFKIAHNKSVDLLRGSYGHHDPLPEEHPEDESLFGEAGAPTDERGLVEVEDAIERCMAERSAAHRLVIELGIFGDLPSREVADEVNSAHPDLERSMSPDNVDKIKSRFRKDLKNALDGDD